MPPLWAQGRTRVLPLVPRTEALMGFWNIKARDLKFNDEVRLGPYGMGVVGDVDTGGASGLVAAQVTVEGAEMEWMTFDPDENLMVRR